MNGYRRMLGKAMRIRCEEETKTETASKVDDVGVGSSIVEYRIGSTNDVSNDRSKGSGGTDMVTTDGLGTSNGIATDNDKGRVETERKGAKCFLFPAAGRENESAVMDFESSWGLRGQVATVGVNHGGIRAASAPAVSPLPLNPIDSMTMRAETEVSSRVATMPCSEGAILRWMNVVLDPWEEKSGSSENNDDGIETSVSWLAHREALKERVMEWCEGQGDTRSGVGGPVGLVYDTLNKDCVSVGQCVVRIWVFSNAVLFLLLLIQSCTCITGWLAGLIVSWSELVRQGIIHIRLTRVSCKPKITIGRGASWSRDKKYYTTGVKIILGSLALCF